MGARHLQNSFSFSSRIVTLTLGCFSILSNDAIEAQIVSDGTVGSQINRVNATRDRITGGATRGSNLFHSFREFNISEGRAAYFANPAAIKTIFSRVTGNNPSQIFGTLGVEGNANLFFINPNGIIFGPNATLDVRGSFIGSTANSIAFPNGENFSATNPNAPPLLTIDVPVPIGLVFESDNSGIILNAANLQTRQNLALIGAGIASSGIVFAPGGDITLTTVPGAVDSIVRLDGTGKFLRTIRGDGQPNLENRDILLSGGGIGAFSTGKAGNVIFNSAGNVSLSDGAIVNVQGAGGGSITVNAQNFEINSGAQFLAGLGEGLGSLGARAGNIEINAAQSLKIQGNSPLGSAIVNQVSARGVGNAGDVIINTGTFEGNGAFNIGSFTLGRGNAGKVIITAKDEVSLDGGGVPAGVASLVAPTAIGNADDIVINARSLSLSNGALVATTTLGQGNAGNIRVKVSESVSVNNRSNLQALTVSSGDAGNITIEAQKGKVSFDGAGSGASTIVFVLPGLVGTGKGGNLTIKANTLSVTDNAQLFTDTSSTGNAGDINLSVRQLLVRDGAAITTMAGLGSQGNGGTLTINATESVRLIGTSANGQPSSGLISATLGKGRAGDLSLTTRQLLVQDGATISTTAGTGSEGDGGTLTVNATESVRLIGTSANGQLSSSLDSATFGKGRAGNLNLTTRQLLVENGAEISAATAGGQGGTITVNADRMEIRNGGQLLTTTSGDSEAGDIKLQVNDSILLTGTNSGLFANTTEDSTKNANGGDIFTDRISPQTLTIADGATISVNSQGKGTGGEVRLQADSLTLDNGSISAETVSTDGGNITLNVQDLLFLRNSSQISTTAGTAEAGGDGGRIFLDAGSIVAVPDENSDITANAFLGDGGRVVIKTDSIFGIDFRQQLTPLSDITASSTAGRQGVVIINTSGIEPTQGLENLTEERINVEVAQGCQVGGTAKGRISFYNVGRGGLPPSPDDLLNSPATQEWLSLESEESTNFQPKVEPSLSQQQENTVASKLIFSCHVR
ncbi:MAG: filamentous hemagglutinin N-terminal domain-containing protein [Hydrococcus sp. Prado102]|jgi:filamentous hemagglutinin family protein|nr:filamentous hemagglutinin N-terminal domain-containing protein [Hydrococcus sp. Prado102]